ncbi:MULTISPECIES: O-antigen ligase family protein [unclassified Streptomyces]|uniref:O-antigen ligase family protein n=1 Tax=unclassified Streptomyces TaxID=2593676 RepID=UPI00382D4E71
MTSAAGADADSDRRNVSDAVGVVVLAACAGWALLTAAGRDGRPEGVLLAVLAVAAGCAAGRMSGSLWPVAAPCAAAVAGPAAALAMPRGAMGSGFATPLGPAGAVAAQLVLATGGLCCAAWATPVPALRFGLRALAAGVAVAGAVAGSAVGCAAAAAVLLCSAAAGRMRHRGAGVAGLALVATVVTGAVWALAADVLPAGLTAATTGPLTERRVLLWRDALHLARRDSALGVGPGRFGGLNGTASGTLPPDGRPHSAPLQLAAEQGLVGVLLLAAVFCWMLYTLWRSPRPTPVVLTAGAALTAVAAVAAVGNALSFTAVSAGAGLLAGLATARPWMAGSPRS